MKLKRLAGILLSSSLLCSSLLSSQIVSAEDTYLSELTNEPISVSIMDQRPIAVMIDNESIALDHFGTNQADIIYEAMNSTANGRITRLMAIVKDWRNIQQLGSIRSTRPTNFMLAAEYNAILVHDGGPFYIDEYVKKDYVNNLSGGFARFNNGKSMEFTEYVTSEAYTNDNGQSFTGLNQRIADSGYSTEYNSYYPGPHFTFADSEITFADRADAITANVASLPFPHNSSTLTYNTATGTYDYAEYGRDHVDALDGSVTTFKNVILENCDFTLLDQNGYMVYNVVTSSAHDGYYLTNGKAIPITWSKDSETAITVYTDAATGEAIKLNTGKTYIGVIPSDGWSSLSIQ